MTVRGQPHLLDTFPSTEEARYLLNWRMSGSEFRFEPFGKVIYFLPLLGFEPQNVQPTAWSLSSPGCPMLFDTASLLLKCQTRLLRTKENTRTPPLESFLNGNRSIAEAVCFSDWERGGGCEFDGDVTRTNGKKFSSADW
jgi:hypothetical protein